jgi:hypothetical protein
LNSKEPRDDPRRHDPLQARAAPLVTCDWESDLDDEHMTAWLERNPELHRMIAQAIELSEQQAAA